MHFMLYHNLRNRLLFLLIWQPWTFYFWLGCQILNLPFTICLDWSPGIFLIWLESCPVYLNTWKRFYHWLCKSSLNPYLATMNGNKWENVAALHIPLSSYLAPFLENWQRHLTQNKSSLCKRSLSQYINFHYPLYIHTLDSCSNHSEDLQP